MKRFLLSFSLLTGCLLSFAQAPLPLTENFDNGTLPVGWESSASQNIGVAAYSVNTTSGCVQNAGGLFVGPSANSSGNNTTGFLSPNLASINSSSIVTIGFNFYAYNKNELTCANQVQTSCNATVRMYIVNRNYEDPAVPPQNMIYGQSALTTVSPNTSANSTPISISAAVSTNVPEGTVFKILLDVSFGDCPGTTGAVRYVVDNVIIATREQAPLPVTFKSFTADRTGATVSLKWVTATEQNNYGFRVQRKNGDSWKTIAFVPSLSQNGNSTTDLQYEFSDLNNEKGVAQYRIEQVDFNGRSLFSAIRAVRGLDLLNKLLIYPNPSNNGVVNIVFEDNSSIRDVLINDAQGRIIKQYRQINDNILVVDKLQSGFYTIKVFNHNTAQSSFEKVVVR